MMTSEESADELFPCPFCGGEALILLDTMGGFSLRDVQCRGCGAIIPGQLTRAEAVEAWNTREQKHE